MSNNEKTRFEKEYKLAWKIATEAINLEKREQFKEASENYRKSAEILSKLLEKPIKQELGNSIRTKLYEYRERAELLESICEKQRKGMQPQKTETASMVLHGPEIGLKAIQILREASSEIMIMSYLIFEVKTLRAENKLYRIDLLDTLIQKSKNGVNIRIITSPPDVQVLGKNAWKQGHALIKILSESNIQIKLCSFAHSKFIVADGLVVFRGSANLTSSGLSGKGDVAEATNDEGIINYYSTIFEERWRNTSKSCQDCTEKSCLKEYPVFKQQ
ncbi:MAG: phospholipase D-like domain-containing protein [Candidatus Jordarchaeaceae archaeon]